MKIKYFGTAEQILLTLWVGGMWAIGYIVAPTLFSILSDNKPLAGQIAGQLFTVISYIGLVAGVLLLVGCISRSEGGLFDGRAITLTVMLALVVVGQFVLQPMMAALKEAGIAAGGQNAAAFAKLHGAASVLFLVNSILGLGLVVFGLKKSG